MPTAVLKKNNLKLGMKGKYGDEKNGKLDNIW
jgi:hypothetical protein